MSDQAPLPHYPASSASASPAPSFPAPVPPQTVTIGFWLYIVAAVLSLIGLIITLTTAGDSKVAIRRSLAAHGQTVSETTLNAALAVGIAVGVIVGLIFLAAYVLFAILMRRGANWARIILFVLTVLSLTGILGSYGIGAARVVVAIIATVLVFLGPSNQYFKAAKTRKLSAGL